MSTGTSLKGVGTFSSHNAILASNMADTPYLSLMEQEEQDELDMYYYQCQQWYSQLRQYVCVSVAAHTVMCWKRAIDKEKRARRRAQRVAGTDVGIGVRRRGVRLFTPRSIWVDHTVGLRAELGNGLLFQHLRQDLRRFHVMTRMSPPEFDILHDLVRDDISKKNTNFRQSISTEEKLASVLR